MHCREIATVAQSNWQGRMRACEPSVVLQAPVPCRRSLLMAAGAFREMCKTPSHIESNNDDVQPACGLLVKFVVNIFAKEAATCRLLAMPLLYQPLLAAKLRCSHPAKFCCVSKAEWPIRLLEANALCSIFVQAILGACKAPIFPIHQNLHACEPCLDALRPTLPSPDLLRPTCCKSGAASAERPLRLPRCIIHRPVFVTGARSCSSPWQGCALLKPQAHTKICRRQGIVPLLYIHPSFPLLRDCSRQVMNHHLLGQRCHLLVPSSEDPVSCCQSGLADGGCWMGKSMLID